ncbi:MAG: PQQ-like beta-propeller repeat protein [Lachnospiraceae bacterium]|nr:PQQ-like beta-propeller repeat protein [Lachnospiraceae bacterium]
MTEQEYKNAMSKIKCSDEFRAKMTAKLSAPEIEVTKNMKNDRLNSNEVSGVENITVKSNRNKKIWMSLASCACVCAIVGAGVLAAKNLNTKPDIIDTPNKAVSVNEKKNTFPFDLRDYEVNCICKINDGNKTEFSLTDEQKKDIYNILLDYEWDNEKEVEWEVASGTPYVALEMKVSENETSVFEVYEGDFCDYFNSKTNADTVLSFSGIYSKVYSYVRNLSGAENKPVETTEANSQNTQTAEKAKKVNFTDYYSSDSYGEEDAHEFTLHDNSGSVNVKFATIIDYDKGNYIGVATATSSETGEPLWQYETERCPVGQCLNVGYIASTGDMFTFLAEGKITCLDMYGNVVWQTEVEMAEAHGVYVNEGMGQTLYAAGPFLHIYELDALTGEILFTHDLRDTEAMFVNLLGQFNVYQGYVVIGTDEGYILVRRGECIRTADEPDKWYESVSETLNNMDASFENSILIENDNRNIKNVISFTDDGRYIINGCVEKTFDKCSIKKAIYYYKDIEAYLVLECDNGGETYEVMLDTWGYNRVTDDVGLSEFESEELKLYSHNEIIDALKAEMNK